VLGKTLKRLSTMKNYEVLPATHSGHKRTARTAFLINNPNTNIKDLEPFDKHSVEATKNILSSSVDKYSEKADKKYAELAQGNFSNEGTAVEYFMKLGDQKYDDKTPSSVEMSQHIAKDIYDIVESTKNMASGTRQFMPNIVHSGVFEHFLIDILEKRHEEKILESIGGPLNFLGFDDFRLYIKRKNENEAIIQFRFRARDKKGVMQYYEITENVLKNLANINNNQ